MACGTSKEYSTAALAIAVSTSFVAAASSAEVVKIIFFAADGAETPIKSVTATACAGIDDGKNNR